MYNLALFSSINFVPYERKFTQKESFQTTYVRRTSMQKTINCVIPKRLFGLLLNCWLETQSTLALLNKIIVIPKISIYFNFDQIISYRFKFLMHFCFFWCLEREVIHSWQKFKIMLVRKPVRKLYSFHAKKLSKHNFWE